MGQTKRLAICGRMSRLGWAGPNRGGRKWEEAQVDGKSGFVDERKPVLGIIDAGRWRWVVMMMEDEGSARESKTCLIAGKLPIINALKEWLLPPEDYGNPLYLGR